MSSGGAGFAGEEFWDSFPTRIDRGMLVVLLALCRDCYRKKRYLVAPTKCADAEAEEVAAQARWADTIPFRHPCTCSRPLPDPSHLRSHIARAVRRGLDPTQDLLAPVVVRI